MAASASHTAGTADTTGTRDTDMLSSETNLWKVRALNGWQVAVVQKASGMLKVFSRTALPDIADLSVMSEVAFNSACRRVFFG
jgi:hypothetical protein